MALLVLILVALVATCGRDEVHGFGSSNFPLDDCSTGEMDVLGLYSDVNSKVEDSVHDQSLAFTELVKHLLSFPNPKKTPRVQFAHVHDSVSSNLPDFNFSSWNFETAYNYKSKPYAVYDGQFIKQVYTNLVEALTLKIQFVERLFAEMGGVRKNVNHVAVVYLHLLGLSYEQSRSAHSILSQYKTDIKIFLVLFTTSSELVVLNDTLLAGSRMVYEQTLIMAVCKQCSNELFVFEHTDGVQYLSCYQVMDNLWPVSASDFTLFPGENCPLANLETKEELNFVRNGIHLYLKESKYLQDTISSGFNFTIKMYINLARDEESNAGRFVWKNDQLETKLPNIVNNWLPGKPSAGRALGCTVWQFDYYVNGNEPDNTEATETGFVDGWKDVSCFKKLTTFILCEFQLPLKIQTRYSHKIEPAKDETVSQVLSKGDFIMFRGNVVSVSANIGDSNFLKFMENTYTKMFPIFDCGSEAGDVRYISYRFVCDSISQCSNNRDEDFCNLFKSSSSGECKPSCNGVYCCDRSCLRLQWINDGEIDCTICDYSTDKRTHDEGLILHMYLKKNITCALICGYQDCVTVSQLNDGHKDCTGKEGPLDEILGKLEEANTCQNILGNTIWAPKCVYVRDIYGGVIGCRDMSHLTKCSNFDCREGYFKCANSYCIPQHYVLDDRADCPTGEDEQMDLVGPCSGNFACWDTKMCIHPSLVCNSHPDCPHGDDEADCRVNCPEGFRCLAGTITIEDYNRDVPLIKLSDEIPGNTRYIDFSGINLSETNIFQTNKAPDVAVINWSKCQISKPDYIKCFCLLRVQVLDMSYNLIQTLDGRDNHLEGYLDNIRHLNVSYNRELVSVQYLNFRFLETLDLSHTAVAEIAASFFEGVPKLKNLDLSFTFIVNFNKVTLPSGLVLQSLVIRGMSVNDLYEALFNDLTIVQHLYTDRFEFCCPQVRGPNIPSHTCHAPDDAISSCFDLIGADTQRVLIWVVASLAVLGNITVIVYRGIWDRPSLTQGFGLFVTNLGVSDFIMGVYLLIIAGADIYYRGDYVLHDRSWRASFPCQFAGFLATFSSETSILFVLLITLDRFLVMKFPFGQVKLSKVAKNIATIIIWMIGFLIALSPVVFGFDTYSSNAVCLGLPLTTKWMKGWEFSFAVFIALNLFLCLVIGYSQRAIFRAMSENRIKNNADSNTSTRRPEDLIVAKQLSLVAIASFLCWFPIGFMGLLSVAKYEISNDVFAWTVAIVLPINSAANPNLYTIPAVMDKWDKLKNGRRRAVKP